MCGTTATRGTHSSILPAAPFRPGRSTRWYTLRLTATLTKSIEVCQEGAPDAAEQRGRATTGRTGRRWVRLDRAGRSGHAHGGTWRGGGRVQRVDGARPGTGARLV